MPVAHESAFGFVDQNAYVYGGYQLSNVVEMLDGRAVVIRNDLEYMAGHHFKRPTYCVTRYKFRTIAIGGSDADTH